MARKVKIITDSTCDLSKEILKERDIEVYPLIVTYGTDSYLDGVDIDTDKLYEIASKTNTLPKTSAIPSYYFEEPFEKFVKEGYDVIFTGIGADLSSTIRNANMARNEFDDEIASHIFVVDSANLSTGTGLLLMKMSDLASEGKSAEEIVSIANEIVPCIRAQFSVSDLTYLHKGGRCSGTAKFFGTMLKIRPILRVINGKIVLDDKVFGRYEKALDLQINDLTNSIENADTDYLFITHSKADEESEYILSHLSDDIKNRFKHIYVTKAGCVISSHCGPHTIGVLYIRKSKI